MRDRLVLGPILIAALIGALWLDEALTRVAIPGGPVWGMAHFPPGTVQFVVMALVCVLAAREMAAILIANGVIASKRIMTFAALLGLVVTAAVPNSSPGLVAVAAVGSAAVCVLVVAQAFYSRHKSVEGVVAATGGALLSFVYLGLTFGFLLAIRRDHSAWVLLWVLLITKACDIGAFFTGKAIGRHKMIPWLSPGKTWEGLVGGLVLSAVVAWTGSLVLHSATGMRGPGLLWCIVLGVGCALVGQAGDLLESMYKRDAGMKDSGRGLPGFGGILDVIDSPVLVAPLAYWLLHALERAGALSESLGSN
ncbi:MAG: phosphatidate cytidylyltransferase [Phycisphaerales bacterium]|jgi:phosphatidate cytidylyltransferase